MKGPAHFERDDGAENFKANSTGFHTENPRHLRAIDALQKRPMPREHLDRAAGCSNGPELVAELRRRGLEVPCPRVPDLDRDGKPIRRGVYFLTDKDRRKIARWLSSRGRP